MEKLPESLDKGKVLSRQFRISLLLGKPPTVALNFNHQVIVHISQIPYQRPDISAESKQREGQARICLSMASNKPVDAKPSVSPNRVEVCSMEGLQRG